MTNQTDIAWCAGFFDGEGSVGYYRQMQGNSKVVSSILSATVPQASDNIEVLQFFQLVIGFGTLRGPYEMPNSRPQHRLTYGVDEVMRLFIILKPYLKKEKTKDFETALMRFFAHDPTPTAEDIAKKIKRAKKKNCTKCGKEWNGMICAECGYIE